MVLRRVRRQALLAILALAVLSAALGSAVAFGQAKTTAKQPLTPAKAASVKKTVEGAIAYEERALTAISETRFPAARSDLFRSAYDLNLEARVLRDYNAGPIAADLDAAHYHDEAAQAELETFRARDTGKRDRQKAAAKIDEALNAKHAAITLLDEVVAPPPPPPTSEPVICSFLSQQGTLVVKVTWTGEGGASLVETLSGAATPVSKTAILNATGVAYTPFTVNTAGTAVITVQASNPKTGKTGSATATAGWGPSTPTASDCGG